jgi:hypothetical protein
MTSANVRPIAHCSAVACVATQTIAARWAFSAARNPASAATATRPMFHATALAI